MLMMRTKHQLSLNCHMILFFIYWWWGHRQITGFSGTFFFLSENCFYCRVFTAVTLHKRQLCRYTFIRLTSPWVGTVGSRMKRQRRLSDVDRTVPACSCCVRSEASHLSTQCCQQKAPLADTRETNIQQRWRQVLAGLACMVSGKDGKSYPKKKASVWKPTEGAVACQVSNPASGIRWLSDDSDHPSMVLRIWRVKWLIQPGGQASTNGGKKEIQCLVRL